MPRHSQRQCLEPLQEQKGVERTHGRPKVAKGFGPQLHQITICAEGFVKLKAVIRGGWVDDYRKTAVGPVELAGVNHDAADARSVTADEFRRREKNAVGA